MYRYRNEHTTEVVVLRGLPGSGKSHYARELVTEHDSKSKFAAQIITADIYPTMTGGNHVFNPDRMHV